MRAILIITVFALFAILPFVHAQDGELPPCMPAELAALSELMGGFYDMHEMIAALRTLDDLRDYSQTHITWRDQLWSSLPLCSPAYKIALLANQLSGDYVSAVLLIPPKDTLDENPYTAWQLSGTATLEALLADLPSAAKADDAAPAAPPAKTLHACDEAEKELLRDTLLPEYSDLTVLAMDVQDFDGFLSYINVQLAWRKESLARYPACAEAIEIAWFESQTAADIATLFAFYFIGESIDDSPYSAPERAGTARLRTLTQALYAAPEADAGADAGSLPDQVIAAIERELGNPSGSNWRACSASELQTILDLIPDYEALVSVAASIETMDDLLAYSSAMIEWREHLVSDLAHCGEVLEVAWIMSEYIGDLAIMHAHAFVDIPSDESPVFQQFMSNVGAVRTWSKVLSDLVNHRESEPEATQGSGNLPACDASELDGINLILADHYALYDAAGAIETLQGYVAFTAGQLEWRERNWARLPLCGDSFEYFLRMAWTNNDTTVAGVLHRFADVAFDDNPFWPAVYGFKERADVLLNRLRGLDAGQEDERANASE